MVERMCACLVGRKADLWDGKLVAQRVSGLAATKEVYSRRDDGMVVYWAVQMEADSVAKMGENSVVL